LKKNHQPVCGLPITIEIKKIRGCGYCLFHPKKGWEIVINSTLTENEAIDTLFHEWAHCLQDQIEPCSKISHTDLWGILYARLYRGYNGE
jgi:Zn-dependent peptidase ImmA (M78 family)